MSSKFAKNVSSKKQLQKRSDADFYKMSSLFFALCAVVLLILKASDTVAVRQATGRNLAYEMYMLFRSPVYIAFAGILLIGSIIWFIVDLKNKVNLREKTFSGLNALAIMLYIGGFSLFFGLRIINSSSDCMFILTATVVLALIYYVSKIFHIDFLIFTIENAFLALFLYRYCYKYSVTDIIGKALLIVAFVLAGIALTKYASKVLSRPHATGKKSSSFMIPYFISLVIWTFFMFIKLPDITGAPILEKGIMLTIMLVQYLVFAICYTIKLIRE